MTQEERIVKIREFLELENLEGTELKLKNQVIELDNKRAASHAEYQQLVQELDQLKTATSNKHSELLSLSNRLEGLCELILSLSPEEANDVG